VKACPLGNDGLHPRAVVPFADVVEQVDANLASTRLADQKSLAAQVGRQFKRERRIVYADSHCHRSPVRPSVSSLSTNDLAESRGAERLVFDDGRSIHSTPASQRKPQKRQMRALSLIC